MNHDPAADPQNAGAGQRPLRIGITGPIGCGKSAIATALAERGGIVVDADALTRHATHPDSLALAQIRGRFGAGVIRRDGSLDRAELGRIVFADPDALRDLEAIVHPAVRPLIERAVGSAESQHPPFVVIEAIRLVEAGLAGQCDEVWLVTCEPGQQRDRLAGRGMPADEIDRRMSAQGTDMIERLRPRATRVIDASGTVEETRRHAFAALDAALMGGAG
jgi:dephospho-CoA kinase